MSSENTNPNPYASPSPISPEDAGNSALALPDRSTGLKLFGIFQILLGCLSGLMGLLMAAVAVVGPMAAAPQGQGINVRSMIPALVVYLVFGAMLFCLGVGSIRARRWAWTLTVILAWMGLVLGAVSLLSFVLFSGRIMSAVANQPTNIPPETLVMIRIVSGAILACIYIGLPGMFLLFYQRESVRATCLRRDPHIPWTDRCPMPVLALSILMALAAVSMVPSMAYGPVMPLCGTFLSGPIAAAVILFMTACMAYCAWGAYRLRMAAWWGMLAFCILGTLNMVVTFSRAGLLEMYEKMQMPPDQLEMIKKFGMVEEMSDLMPWMGVVGGLAWLGYLLYVRHYFVGKVKGELADTGASA